MGLEILVSSGDEALLADLRETCREGGVELRAQAAEGLFEAVKKRLPEVLVLDLDQGDAPPWELVTGLRADPQTLRLPLVFISARYRNPRQVVEGLRRGAVEYLLKHIDPRVLLARIAALTAALERRRRAEREGPLKAADGKLILDAKAHRCSVQDGERILEVELSPKEFQILSFLMARQKQMVSKEELLRSIWPSSVKKSEQTLVTLAQYISRIRKKVGTNIGKQIKTVWGLGYRLD